MKRIKIAFFAATALVAGATAVATTQSASANAKHASFALRTYGVLSTTATTYTVVDITGQTKGDQYSCVNPVKVCTFQADPTHVVSSKITKTDATIISKVTGTFQVNP